MFTQKTIKLTQIRFTAVLNPLPQHSFLEIPNIIGIKDCSVLSIASDRWMNE